MNRLCLSVCAAAVAGSAFSQLYDNGPLATGSVSSLGTTAPAGTQWSEIQKVGSTSNAIISLGVAYNIASPNRLADDFTVGAGGWNVSSIVVYGSQTGSTTTSTLTTGVVQIWNGKPGVAGSSVVAGDLTTNRLSSSIFTNLYRTGRGVSSTSAPIMAATLNLPVFLGQGTYWMEYGLTGSLTPTVKSPLVTVPNQLTVPGANGVFFSASYLDIADTSSNLPQAVPFQVLGQPAPEPASMLALGLGGVALIRRRRKA